MSRRIILATLLIVLFCFATGNAEPIYQTVDVPEKKMLAVSRLLTDVSGGLGITYSLYYSTAPVVVLYGEPENLRQMMNLLEECFQAKTVDSLLNIHCSLQSMQEGDMINLGFLPPLGVQATGSYQRYNTNASGTNRAYDIWNLTLSTLDAGSLKLQQGFDTGNIIISGDITTENGLSGELKSKKALPLPVATSTSSTTSITYKDVITEVKVLPTILEYDTENPENSKVRLDIHVKISFVNKTTYTDSEYPYISIREYDVMRVVKANKQPYITAAIARDTKLKINSGVPILKELPVLKYIFGSEYVRNLREYDILKIKVGWLKN